MALACGESTKENNCMTEIKTARDIERDVIKHQIDKVKWLGEPGDAIWKLEWTIPLGDNWLKAHDVATKIQSFTGIDRQKVLHYIYEEVMVDV